MLLEAVLAGNIVPGSQERSKHAERSERAEQCSEYSWVCSEHVAKISMLKLNIGSDKLWRARVHGESASKWYCNEGS